MAQFYDQLDDKLIEFIGEQRMFFTATAAEGTRINLSPKGMDCFRVIDDRTVAYLDMTGSGNETSAHIEHDGRLTIMMCSYGPKPWILRLYGRGEVIRRRDPRWAEFGAKFDPISGHRQYIALHIESIQTSCGYAVPRYEFISHRDTLAKWAESKGEDGLAEYWSQKNVKSIDGLPTFLLDARGSVNATP